MRDNRINTIIEGASEIMRLFIAREALDPHMKAAGTLINPKAAKGPWQLAGDALRAAWFYAHWYPKRWLPHGLPGTYSDYGPLAKHVSYVSRHSNRLARNLIHLMALNGPGLEKRQAVLGRAVDVGVELFAMACACSFARHLAEKEKKPQAVDLADQFCRQSRARVAASFRGLWRNEDRRNYALAQQLMAGNYSWLESGVMPIEDFKN